MADSTLAALRQKVRRLTRSPSPALVPDAQIDEYVNTFIAYDFPEHLKTFKLTQTFSFYTSAYKDSYATNDATSANLLNFENINLNVKEPLYIGGYLAQYTQSESEFFAWFPKITSKVQFAQGNGVTLLYAGIITGAPFLTGEVVISSFDQFGLTIAAHDDGLGNLLQNDTNAIIGAIDYISGAFNINFPIAPGVGQPIYTQTVPYEPSRPSMMMYFQNIFYLRPVPDDSYKVEFEVYVRPTQLLQAGQSPQLEEWWQYISYGAAKKLLEDRSDYDTVQKIMPEYLEQQALCNRRTLVQYSEQRATTIYTQQTEYGSINNGWWWTTR